MEEKMRRRLPKEEIERRIKWKELYARVRRIPGVRVYDIADSVNGLLKSLTVRERISVEILNIYASISKNQKDLRVPSNKFVVNALVYALDSLGAWSRVGDPEKDTEKKELVELLGFQLIDFPNVFLPIDLPNPPRFRYDIQCISLNEARARVKEMSLSANEVLYSTALYELSSIYNNKDQKTRTEIVADLEKIIEKHKSSGETS